MNAPPSSPIQKISKPKATGRKGPFTNEDLTFQWKNNFGISKEDSSITYPVTDTEGKVIMCNQLGRSQVKYTRVLFEQKTQASFMGERYFSTSRKEMIIDPLSTMVYKRFLELEKGPRDSESVIPENMFTWTGVGLGFVFVFVDWSDFSFTAEMTDLMEGSQEDHRDEAFTYRKVTMDHLKDLRSSIDGFRGHVDKLINFMDDSKFCVVSPEDNSDSTVEVDGKMMDHAFYDTMESFVGVGLRFCLIRLCFLTFFVLWQDLDVDIAGFTFDLEAIKEDMKKEYQASGTLKWRETFEVDEDAYEAANGDDKGDDAINCHDGAGVSCNDADADSDADA